MSEEFSFSSHFGSSDVSQSELSEVEPSCLGQFSFGPEEGSEVENINNSSSGQKPRKRKIDKDGFVTPATPDIPKASCYYSLKDQEGSEGCEVYGRGEEESPTSSSFSVTPEYCDPTSLQETEDAGQNIQHHIKDIDSMPDSEEKKQGIKELIQDLSQEMKFVYTEWSHIFHESEDFEGACTTRLDNLIAQARNLEENLNTQKEMLCQRLKGLSNTLQML